MAFGTGKVSSDGTGGFKRYVGVGSVKILAINPTMEEWNKITGGNLTKEPEYTSVKDDIKQAHVTLLVETDPKHTEGNLKVIIPVTFWFKRAAIKGQNSGKFVVIDKYGRTAWATQEDIDNKRVPQYSNGPANIDKDYRKAVSGEEAFTNFLKAHLVIPALSYKDKNGNIVNHPNPKECEARLDDIMKIFDGDFSEIKRILNYQPNNYSKMLFGVRVTDDGKEFQDVFMDLFLTNGNTKEMTFAKKLAELAAGGRHTYDKTYFGNYGANGELIITPFKERIVAPTEFTETQTDIPEVTTGDDYTSEEENPSDLPF